MPSTTAGKMAKARYSGQEASISQRVAVWNSAAARSYSRRAIRALSCGPIASRFPSSTNVPTIASLLTAA